MEKNRKTLTNALAALPEKLPEPDLWPSIQEELDHDIRKLLHQYYQAWQQRSFDALPLAENLSYKGPLSNCQGRQMFKEAFHEIKDTYMQVIDLHIVVQRPLACARYKSFTMNGQMLDMCEWFSFEGDKINSIEVYFDTSGFANQMTG